MSRSLIFSIGALALCTAAHVATTSAKPAANVQFQIALTSVGRLGSCKITKSSGDAELDRKTCDIVKACLAKGVPLSKLNDCKSPVAVTKAEN